MMNIKRRWKKSILKCAALLAKIAKTFNYKKSKNALESAISETSKKLAAPGPLCERNDATRHANFNNEAEEQGLCDMSAYFYTRT